MFKSGLAALIIVLLANAEAQFGVGPPFGVGPQFGVGPPFGSRPPAGFGLPSLHGDGFPGPHPRPHPFPNPRPLPPPRPLRPPRPLPPQPPQFSSLRLCTTTQLEQDKCLYALDIAGNNSIDLKLECVQTDSFDDCLQAVQTKEADLVVADEHEYLKARSADLVPLLYAHETLTSYYIAVAPKNITLLELSNATLDVNAMDERAFHAAALFNLHRGHDLCDQAAEGDVTIQIIDSADYDPTDDELLICADGSVLYAGDYDYSECNIDAGLELGIFAPRPYDTNRSFTRLLQNVFDTLINSLGQESEVWNFFSDFQGTSDVIFKNDTSGFSLIPVNRNGVTEQKFTSLHCDQVSLDH
ncbi:transferrin-like [Eurosta solidaginis]|uniref:transferrin-like n=1 Tax=Eurosta solidaginis TaxID=178769 RepID=UPI003530CDD0